jgi:hypothetical protein
MIMITTMTRGLDDGARLSLQIANDRAYAAMYAAEQRFGHGSPAHCVAWTVFSETGALLRGEPTGARAFVDQAERYHALDMVNALCTGRRGRKGTNIKTIVAEMAARPAAMGGGWREVWERRQAIVAEMAGNPEMLATLLRAAAMERA